MAPARQWLILGCAAALLFQAASATSASAEGNHAFDPLLSLTGGTGVTKLDPVADPGPAHPPKPFALPCDVAVDPNGYVYVSNQGEANEEGKVLNGRIDVFNPAGEFLVEFKNDLQPCALDVDASGNLYVAQNAVGDTGVFRYSPSAYPPTSAVTYGSKTLVVSAVVPGVAVNQQTGHLFVSTLHHVEEYSSAAEGNTLVRGDIGEGIAKFTRGVAVDSSTGDIMVGSLCTSCEPSPTSAKPHVSLVYVFDSTGALKATIDGSDLPGGGFKTGFGELYPAVDEKSGEVFISDKTLAYRFVLSGAAYEFLPDPELEDHSYVPPTKIAVANGATNPIKGNVYVTSNNSPAHLFAFTPEAEINAPLIASATFTNPTLEDASLRAEINPGGAATTYRFEYVAEATYQQDLEGLGSGHGFDHALLAGTGSLAAGSQPLPVSAFVAGLTPDTRYRFRIVAANHCQPSEPEVLCTTFSEEVAFATYPEGPQPVACPNEALRAGLSAALPDCRAYELVTPADTNGRDPNARFVEGFDTELASADGNGLLFMTYGGTLPGPLGGTGIVDGYEASRSPLGWQTHLAGPTGAQSQAAKPGGASPDHAYWLWKTGGETDHGSLVIGEDPTSYVRLPDGSFRLVGEGPLRTDPGASASWIAPGGAHLIFTSFKSLVEGASPPGVPAIYDRTLDGSVHVVSLKPDGGAPPLGASVKYEGSSADGTTVAFTVTEAGVPTLYIRRHNAVTLPVATGPLTFAGLSSDGGRLAFLKGGNLFSFDVPSDTTSSVGSGGKSVPVNVSADGSHVYFVSTKTLGADPGSVAGKENFYVWDAETETVHFIAVLIGQDVSGTKFGGGTFIGYGLGLWLQGIEPSQSALEGLGLDPSRTTPDGRTVVFESRANLTGYDSGGHSQVYRYQAGESPQLTCLSCVPTLAATGGDAHLQVLPVSDDQAPTHSSVPTHNISADGRTVFFQSPEPLVPNDVDGVEDVYEWQAQGTGGCTRSPGCLSLISSGRSESPNYLFAATASGSDVFFTSPDLLTGADSDVTLSIYDARVGGGFPNAARFPCVGEACRGRPADAPSLSSSSSSAGSSEAKPAKTCAKNQRKVRRQGNVKCVPKKHRKQHRPRTKSKHRGSR